jgi:hypothetical protein
MPKPITVKETESRNAANGRPAGEKRKKAHVRPEVAKLIDKVTKENAPTWEALAKR